MNPTIYNFTLDLQSAMSQVTLSARKGDRGRFASVTLTSGGVPYKIEHGCYAVLNAKRVSDDTLLEDVGCVVKDDSIEFNVNDIAKCKEGRVDCDLTLYSPDGQAITSPKFAVVVYAGTTTGDDVEDTDEYRTLGELVAQAKAAKESAEAAATQAAHGGAVSFNGRVGAVTPETGDYTYNMVGADPAGAASLEVTNHNLNEAAHAGLFGACSKTGHTHEATDVSDFSNAVGECIANYGAAKIATGGVSMSGSTGTISGLAFTPKIIFLHSGIGSDGICAASLYAIYGVDGAIMRYRDRSTENTYTYGDDTVRVDWETDGAIFAGLYTGLDIRGYSFVAIG